MPQSGVVQFEYGLSTVQSLDEDGEPDVVPFVAIGTATQAAVVDIELTHAHVYYGAVRAQVRMSTTYGGRLACSSPPRVLAATERSRNAQRVVQRWCDG